MPSLFPMKHDEIESHRAVVPMSRRGSKQVYRASFASLMGADNCENVFCFFSHA